MISIRFIGDYLLQILILIYSNLFHLVFAGVNVGDHFFSRCEMIAIGFHSHWLNGIDFMGKNFERKVSLSTLTSKTIWTVMDIFLARQNQNTLMIIVDYNCEFQIIMDMLFYHRSQNSIYLIAIATF